MSEKIKQIFRIVCRQSFFIGLPGFYISLDLVFIDILFNLNSGSYLLYRSVRTGATARAPDRGERLLF